MGDRRCCCCPDCIRDIAASCVNDMTVWEEVAGSWGFGDCYQTYDSDALLIHTTTLPTSAMRIAVAFRNFGPFNPNIFKAILAYADVDNYLYVEAHIAGTPKYVYLSIHEVIGGVDTELASDSREYYSGTLLDINAAHWDGNIAFRWSSVNMGPALHPVDADYLSATCSDKTALGNRAGFGTGTISGVSPRDRCTFSGLLAYPSSETCNNSSCSRVKWKTWPTLMQVEFDGVTANSCSPGNCDEINTTVYLIPRYNSGTGNDVWETVPDKVGSCSWLAKGTTDYYGDDPLLPDCWAYPMMDYVYIFLNWISDSLVGLSIYVDQGNVGLNSCAYGSTTIPANCGVIDGLAAIKGLQISMTNRSNKYCNFDGATATVTAIA